MEITVFTDSEKTKGIFPRTDRKNGHSTIFQPRGDIKKSLKDAPGDSLFYFDIEGYGERETKALLKSLGKYPYIHYGLIDPDGQVEDAAALFHDGAVDYIGPSLAGKNITAARLKKTLLFNSLKPKSNGNGNSSGIIRNLIISGDNWENITQGNEYTFCFMFVGLDNQSAIEKKLGAGHLEKIKDAFLGIIADMAAPLNGKLWMYSGGEAVILFPFNGNSCPAIVAALEMVFARKIFNFEEFDFNTAISFRTILHLGNTVYKKRGETGDIVSNALNFLFHCAHKNSRPGSLMITESLFDLIPEGIKDLFIGMDPFENTGLKRLKALS